jgi:retron-type reverse transcriptase
MANLKDKMVQGAVKIVSGDIYEPRFLKASHGFCLDHLCYTVFRQIKREWIETPWILEFDIAKYYV